MALSRQTYREIARAAGVSLSIVRLWDGVQLHSVSAVWSIGVREFGREAMAAMHVRLQAARLQALCSTHGQQRRTAHDH